ncbi:MAG: 30S ribosomal protein S13 [Candidatus Diapherotrites archaeon]|nr:30S ribosomal protein S13 [Candidatus Diapherotrites archaeon]
MAEFNYIVRVIGKDLDGTKSVESGLQGIKGIGQRMGGLIAGQFRKETGAPVEKRLGELETAEIKKIEEIISAPEKHGLPQWTLNRRNDIETGKDKHITMNDLAFSLRNDLTRMAEIKSYKGLRHMWGLPVRGQKTKSKHRGKGGVVGVAKKDQAKPGAKPVPVKEAKK